MPDKDYSEQVADSMGIPVGEDAGEKDKPQLSEQLLQQLLQMANQPAQMPPAPQAMSIPEALALATMGTMYKSQMSQDLLRGYVLPELQYRETYPERLAGAQAQAQQQQFNRKAKLYDVLESKRTLKEAREEGLNNSTYLFGTYLPQMLDQLDHEVEALSPRWAEDGVPSEYIGASKSRVSDLRTAVRSAQEMVASGQRLPDFFGTDIRGRIEQEFGMIKGMRGLAPAPPEGGAKLTGTVQLALSELDSTIGLADNALSWVQQNQISDPGLWQALVDWTWGQVPDDLVNIFSASGMNRAELESEGRTVLATFGNIVMKQLAGANVTESEMGRIRKTIAETGKGYYANMVAMTRIRDWLIDNRRALEIRAGIRQELISSGMSDAAATAEARERTPLFDTAFDRPPHLLTNVAPMKFNEDEVETIGDIRADVAGGGEEEESGGFKNPLRRLLTSTIAQRGHLTGSTASRPEPLPDSPAYFESLGYSRQEALRKSAELRARKRGVR